MGSRTDGHFGTTTVAFDAPVKVEPTYVSVPIPISVDLLSAYLQPVRLNDGDLVGVDLSPDSPVGALDQVVASAALTLPVPQPVIDLFESGVLWVGQTLSLVDGETRNDLGLVKSYDRAENTVKVSLPTADTFPEGSVILVTTCMCPPLFSTDTVGWVEVVASDVLIAFGVTNPGGGYIPAGKNLRVRYKNTGTSQVRVVIRFEFLY